MDNKDNDYLERLRDKEAEQETLQEAKLGQKEDRTSEEEVAISDSFIGKIFNSKDLEYKGLLNKLIDDIQSIFAPAPPPDEETPGLGLIGIIRKLAGGVGKLFISLSILPFGLASKKYRILAKVLALAAFADIMRSIINAVIYPMRLAATMLKLSVLKNLKTKTTDLNKSKAEKEKTKEKSEAKEESKEEKIERVRVEEVEKVKGKDQALQKQQIEIDRQKTELSKDQIQKEKALERTLHDQAKQISPISEQQKLDKLAEKEFNQERPKLRDPEARMERQPHERFQHSNNLNVADNVVKDLANAAALGGKIAGTIMNVAMEIGAKAVKESPPSQGAAQESSATLVIRFRPTNEKSADSPSGKQESTPSKEEKPVLGQFTKGEATKSSDPGKGGIGGKA